MNNRIRLFVIILIASILTPSLYFYANVQQREKVNSYIKNNRTTIATTQVTPKTTVVFETPLITENSSFDINPVGKDFSPATVLLYSTPRWYRTRPYSCPINCTFVLDRNRFHESPVIVFDLTTFKGQVPAKNYTEQKYVGFSKEGPGYYPRLKDEAFMSQFDWKMSYRLDSDILEPYFNYAPKLFLTPPYQKKEKALAMFAASNCSPKNKRNYYVTELMKHISIDSYGKCLHNKEFPPGNEKDYKRQKMEIMKKYKFYLAFENHSAKDYVTEKFFQSLLVGTVPVYMGASNIDDFMPSPHSIIKVSDFKDPKALASHLKYLDKNETAYQEYLSWKRDGYSQQFTNLLNHYKMDSKCILCIRASEIANNTTI